MDIRIIRSRQAIFETYMSLMEKYPFQQISIKMITETANIGRATFYLHFKDKNDMRDQCLEMHLENMFSMCVGDKGVVTSKSVMLTSFEYLETHSSFYQIILNGEDNSFFRNKMEEIFRIGLKEFFEKRDFNPNVDKTLAIQFVVCAGVGLVEWWLKNKNEYKSGYLVDQFWNIMNTIGR